MPEALPVVGASRPTLAGMLNLDDIEVSEVGVGLKGVMGADA